MKFIKENIYPISLFIFIFLVSILIPLGGDDWINYLSKNLSFSQIIDNAVTFYQGWEGRFFSRIALSLLVPNQFIWAILNASLMTVFYIMIIKIIGKRYQKVLYPIVLMFILLVQNGIFGQVYVWKTGNVTYLIPMVYMMYLIYIRRDLLNGGVVKYKKLEYLFIPLTFIFSMFIENVSVAIVLVCLFNVIINYVKNKKIDKVMFGCLITSIIGLLLMAFSPGNFMRLETTGDFGELNIFGKVMVNFPKFINYTFMYMPFIIIFSLIIMFMIINKNVKEKFIKVFLFIYLGIIPILSIIADYIGNIIKSDFLIYLGNYNKPEIILFWVIYIIVFTITLVVFFKKYKYYKPLYFIAVGLISNLSMMLSPIWSGRTTCLTYFMLCIGFLMIILKMNPNIFDKKIFKYVANTLIILFMLGFTLYSGYVYKENTLRNKYINYQIEKGDYDRVEILYLPSYSVFGLNVWASVGPFADSFKKSYGIKNDAHLIMVKKENIGIDLDKLKTSDKLKN